MGQYLDIQRGLSVLFSALLLALLLCPHADGQLARKSVRVRSTQGGIVVRGDSEIDTNDYTMVSVRYQLQIDAARKHIVAFVTLDAYECNRDKTFGDSHLRLAFRRTVYTAPTGQTIVKIVGTTLTASHREFLRGKRHGPQRFQRRRIGSLTHALFTIDGKGRRDHNRMSFDGTIEFTPVLR